MQPSPRLRRSPDAVVRFTFIAATALAAGLAWPARAGAQQACGDTTCPKGFQCVTLPAPCPAIACREGADCPPCVPQTTYTCAPAACVTDADCGPHMACAENTTVTCPTSPPTTTCPVGADCIPPDAPTGTADPPQCTVTTVKLCAPRWTLACHTAADCGEGFTCEAQQSCTCSSGGSGSSGSGGTPTPGGTSTAPAGDSSGAGGGTGSGATRVAVDGGTTDPGFVAPSCTCTPTGVSACVAVTTTCTAASECVTDWTCEARGGSSSCGTTSDGVGLACPTVEPVKQCVPPYADLVGARDVGGKTTTTDPSGTPPPTAGEHAPTTSHGAGCSVGGSSDPAPAGTVALALLALGLFGRRRVRGRKSPN